MDYAYQALKTVRSGITLSADMGTEDFVRAVGQAWSQVTSEVAHKLEADLMLQSIYRGILNQTKATSTLFQWLGQPETFYSFGQARNKPHMLKYPLFLLALLFLVWESYRQWNAKSYLLLILCGMVIIALIASLLLFLMDTPKAGPMGSVHVEQRIDVKLAWNSMEKIAMAVDNYATALYAHFAEMEGERKDSLDGLSLAKALIDWDCQEEQVPDEIRTVLRIYLHDHAIEIVQFSPERKEIFQVMPANGTRTIEPALVKKTKVEKDGVLVEEEILLHRGLACVKQQL